MPLGAQDATFRAETRLSLVHFHVVQGQRLIGGVKPADLELLEDGAVKPIHFLEGGGTESAAIPLDLILLFDQSGSVMNANLLSPLMFQQKLLDELPNVRLAVYGFTNNLRKYASPTRDAAQLSAAFESLRAGHASDERIPLALFPKTSAGKGMTWLYEAILRTAEDTTRSNEKVVRNMVVFSDGLGATTAQARDAAGPCEALGIPVYPVILGHRRVLDRLQNAGVKQPPAASSTFPSNPKSRKANSPDANARALAQKQRQEEKAAAREKSAENAEARERLVEDFARLGEMTGGRSFDPPEISLDVMQKVLEGMAVLMRTEYIAGFVPEGAGGAPRKHKIEIKLRNSELGKLVGGKREASY
jgi:VWFA-related protein